MREPEPPPLLRFGPFEADLRNRELLRQGVRVPLQAQPFEVLVALLEAPGDLVTREALRARLWPEGTFVEFDQGLNTAVRKLREALGDDPRAPHFIETRARLGYRFIGGVQAAGEGEHDAARPEGHPGGPAEPESDSGAEPEAVVAPPREASSRRPRFLRRAGIAGAFGAVALLAAVLISRTPTPRPVSPPVRFRVDAPAGTRLPGELAISPDGRTIAFIAEVPETRRRSLWVRRLDDLETREVEGTESASYPFWSPDGRSLGFFADGHLVRFDLDAPARPRQLAAAPDPRGGSWGVDGSILFSPEISEPLYVVSADGGAPKPVTRLGADPSHRWPSFLPDGRRFLYLALMADRGSSELRLATLSGEGGRSLGPFQSNAVWTSRNQLFFASGGSLWQERRVAIDGPRSADPVLVMRGIRAAGEWGPTGLGPFAVSRDGVVAVAPTRDRVIQLVRVDRQGDELGPVGDPEIAYDFHLAADGRNLLFVRGDEETRTSDVWEVDLETGAASRITLDTNPDSLPVSSPSGDRVAFTSLRSSRWAIYIRSKGSRDDRHLFDLELGGGVSDWSSDGRWLVGSRIGADRKLSLWRFDLEHPDGPQPLASSAADDAQPRISPDGRWVAFVSDRSGAAEIYVAPIDDSASPLRVSTDGGEQPAWSPAGSELFYLAPDRTLMVATSRSPATFDPSDPRPLFRSPGSETGDLRFWSKEYLVGPRGETFLIPQVVEPGGAEYLTVEVSP